MDELRLSTLQQLATVHSVLCDNWYAVSGICNPTQVSRSQPNPTAGGIWMRNYSLFSRRHEAVKSVSVIKMVTIWKVDNGMIDSDLRFAFLRLRFALFGKIYTSN